MSYTLDQLRRLAETYCSSTGARPSSLGRSICRNPIVLPRIMAGEGCQADTAEATSAWFDLNWPAGLAWPPELPRNPSPAAPRARTARSSAFASRLARASAATAGPPNGGGREGKMASDSGETLTFWFEPNGDERWPVEVDIGSDRASWFFADEICAVLGLKQPASAVRILDPTQVRVRTTHRNGRKRDRLMVSEGGFYVLASRSRKPLARKFTLWWSEEVLPQIRRTGKYDLRGRAKVDERQLEMWDILGLPLALAGGASPERIRRYNPVTSALMVGRFGSAAERLWALSSIGVDEHISRGMSYREAAVFVPQANKAVLPFEQPPAPFRGGGFMAPANYDGAEVEGEVEDLDEAAE